MTSRLGLGHTGSGGRRERQRGPVGGAPAPRTGAPVVVQGQAMHGVSPMNGLSLVCLPYTLVCV